MRQLILTLLLLTLTACTYKYTDIEAVAGGYYHEDAYSTTSFIMVGKSMIPTTSYHPECWYIEFCGGGWCQKFPVDSNYNGWRTGMKTKMKLVEEDFFGHKAYSLSF